MEVANFLASRARQQQSVAAVNTLAAAISHHHTKRFLVSPTENKTVRLLLDSIKKNYTKAASQKKVFTKDILKRARERSVEAGRLWRWRTTWRMHIAFYAMLRWDESSHLRTGVVKISQWGMHLTIRSSKTDQAGEGATVAIKRLDKAEDCPVTLTEQYWHRLGYHSGDRTSWLQPRIQCTKDTEKGIGEYRISYSNASADLKKMLQEIGEDLSLIHI